MARPREFDTDEALAAITDVFCEKGVFSIDESAAKKVVPKSVNLNLGEQPIFGTCQPCRQLGEAPVGRDGLVDIVAQHARGRGASRSWIVDFSFGDNLDDLFAHKLVLVEFVTALVVDDLVVDTRE